MQRCIYAGHLRRKAGGKGCFEISSKSCLLLDRPCPTLLAACCISKAVPTKFENILDCDLGALFIRAATFRNHRSPYPDATEKYYPSIPFWQSLLGL